MPNKISTRYIVDPETGDLITPNRTLINLSGETVLWEGVLYSPTSEVVLTPQDLERIDVLEFIGTYAESSATPATDYKNMWTSTVRLRELSSEKTNYISTVGLVADSYTSSPSFGEYGFTLRVVKSEEGGLTITTWQKGEFTVDGFQWMDALTNPVFKLTKIIGRLPVNVLPTPVPPDAAAREGDYADAKDTYEAIKNLIAPTPVAPDEYAVQGDFADAADTYTALETKVDKDQGVDNAGLYLGINAEGMVFPTPGGGGGSDTYTNSAPTLVSLGGIPSGSTFDAKTMTQMWDMLLYPYKAPGVSIQFTYNGSSLNPQRIGDYSHITNVTVRITKQSYDIVSCTLNMGGMSLPVTKVTGSENYQTGTVALDLLYNATFSTQVKDTTTIPVNASASQTFIHPVYWLMSTTAAPTQTEFLAGTMILNANVGRTLSYTGTGHPCYGVPAPALVNSIRDQNNFDLLGSFTRSQLTFPVPNDQESPARTVTYNIVALTEQTTVSGFSYTFG